MPASRACWLLLAAMGGVVFLLGLVTTTQWALGTAARTAAMFDSGGPKPSGPLRLRTGDIPERL